MLFTRLRFLYFPWPAGKGSLIYQFYIKYDFKEKKKKQREDESNSNKITKLHKPTICAANMFCYIIFITSDSQDAHLLLLTTFCCISWKLFVLWSPSMNDSLIYLFEEIRISEYNTGSQVCWLSNAKEQI